MGFKIWNVITTFRQFSYLRYCIVFLLACLTLSMLVTSAFPVEADVTILNSNEYREQSVVTLDDDHAIKEIWYEHVWSDFKGQVPEGVLANAVFIKFSWSPVIRTIADEKSEEVSPILEDVHSSTSLLENIEAVVPEASGTDDNVSDTDIEILPRAPDATEPTGDTLSESPVIETPSTTYDDTDNEVLIPEEITPETFEQPETEEFEQVSKHMLYTLAQAQIEEISEDESTTTSPIVSSDIIFAESISTTSGFVASDIVSVNHAEKSFEVQYSIDGATWHTLGSIGFDGAHEVIYDISHVSVDMLPNLQIAARYTASEDDQIRIIFDSMEVIVDYSFPFQEIIEYPTPHDNEPNFEIGSVKADIQSENIRALVLERGGGFEFWYSVTDPMSGKITWNKILGGGPIDPNAPIGIKKRTIFWLDQNQQTLYGFTVDEESIFASSFEDPEHKVFLLPFTDEDGGKWEALFDSSETTLRFHRVKNESS